MIQEDILHQLLWFTHVCTCTNPTHAPTLHIHTHKSHSHTEFSKKLHVSKIRWVPDTMISSKRLLRLDWIGLQGKLKKWVRVSQS